jgi:class 3 adenylate cyclase
MKFIKIKKLIITILIFLTPISLIISQEESETSNPLILYMDKIYDVIPHAEIYEDKTGNLSFEEVIEKEFKPSNQNSYNFGFTSSVYWLRFQIKNQNSFLNDDWIFFVEYPQLDSVNFYFPIDHEQEEEDVYIEKEGGDQLPFAKRDIESRVLNFTVPFEISKDPVIYMRVHSISVMQIPVYLAPQRLFHMRDNETQIIMGIYFGIMLIMGFYNLFLFFSLREKIYLYYVLTVFFSILYMVSFHGYGYRHFWSEYPYIQNRVIHLSGLTTIFFLNLFTVEFLDTKKFAPFLDKILKVLLLLSIPAFIISFFLSSNVPIILINLISLFYPGVLIASGIIVLRKGNKAARLYLVGWGFAAIVGSFTVMRSFGLIQDHRLLNYLSLITGSLEVAFFSFALADKINILKKAKAEAEEKLISTLEEANQELEKRVKERTKELSRSNKQNESLLLNILPNHVIERIKSHDEVLIVDSIPFASILFADVVGFTKLSQTVAATDLIILLNNVFSHFDVLTMVHNLEKMKTIGDSYMVVGGLPGTIDNHLEAMADLALDLLKFSHQQELIDLLMKYPDFKIRVGINCGPAVAGVIGLEKIAYDIWGDTVNTASRMESYGLPDMIHTSKQVYDQLKGKYIFEKRGMIDIKGKGMMETYFLIDKFPPKSK